MKPVYLLADSQVLFWKSNGVLFLDSVREILSNESPKAAYIGASNGDVEEFYTLFLEAMGGAGIRNCKMIRTPLTQEDESFVRAADVILLAGGDVEMGWKILDRSGLRKIILQRYQEGAVLIGVSAGSVQLGLYGFKSSALSSYELIDTFKIVPFIIDTHEEKRDWERLAATVNLLEGAVKGIGIPTGGALIYHPDHSIEAIRHSATEFASVDQRLATTFLLPGFAQAGDRLFGYE